MATRIIIQRENGCSSGCGIFSIIGLAGWITAVVRDAMMLNWLWLIFDIALAPLGAVRGILMWFGLA